MTDTSASDIGPEVLREDRVFSHRMCRKLSAERDLWTYRNDESGTP